MQLTINIENKTLQKQLSHYLSDKKQETFPVGRGILTPTKTKTINKFNISNKNQYDNVCRDRDIPTYRYKA